jgi:hypothetical protein
MVKPRASSILAAASSLVGVTLSGLTLAGCASAPRSSAPSQQPSLVAAPAMDAVVSPSSFEARKLWTREVPGLMTDLSVSRDGSAILMATVPNPEAGSGPRETGHGLTRYDRSGKKVWRIELKGVVKSLALTDDGKLALVSTYNSELLAIDARGRIAWKADGMCKPVPMGKRFLCYHDDDAEPGVAFDVFTAGGRKILVYPITRDVLALKVSDDERNVAIALEGGQVILFDRELRSLWQRQVGGEVIDLAVSAGQHPRVGVLYNPGSPSASEGEAATGGGIGAGQGIAFFDDRGEMIGQASPRAHSGQIETLSGGTGFATFGNSHQGQTVAYYEIPAMAQPAPAGSAPAPIPEKWRRAYPRPADYTPSLITTRDLVIVGFEESVPGERKSHLLAFDPEGALKWNIPLVTQDGAYLYAHEFAPKPSLLAVGTDDGFLSVYRLSESKAAKRRQQPGVSAGELVQGASGSADANAADSFVERSGEVPDADIQGNGEEEDDSVPFAARIRPWLSEGAGLSTSINQRRFANRATLGVDLDIGEDLEWSFGAMYEVFTSSEATPELGGLHRQSTLFSVGYFFVPNRWYGKFVGGAQAVSGTHADASTHFVWTAGLVLGTRVPLTESHRFDLGLEASFEASRATPSSSLLGQTAIVFPAESAFTLSAVFGVAFGRLR